MRVILFILILLQFVFLPSLQSQTDNNKWVIVLDAGHGGKDPGALGKRSKEKDIVLDLVHRVAKYLDENFDDVKIVYTRNTDVFIELDKRAKIANDAEADLFISVHCNANAKTTPNGTEVYVMGLNKTEANLEVAMKENSAALLEDNHEEKYDGIDPNSSEAYIAFSIFQNIFIERSLNMAQILMKSMNKHVGLFERGVKQAPFFVLYRTAMPAILIETGFISNYSDETILMSEAGKEKIAYAIYVAITEYRNLTQNKSFQTGPMHKTEENNSANNSQTNSTISQAEGVVFRIQFASFKDIVATTDQRFSSLKNVVYEKSGNYYKYYCGESALYSEVSNYLPEVKKAGYADAFIVAFKNGTPISVQDARKLSGQ
ncbi:MAG: N-acetylmuramoyl-L-alanine amidase [Bacteroidetes bacterium HGW-Bacteroidetes-6]|jgi:N-acetylmuramoyl-L-alanine amidase|nr:MAG: N-acetylmuramoyl-L-alanine amidase [Bacteroidetes bacterium HGW-Bacteroidetes-6]